MSGRESMFNAWGWGPPGDLSIRSQLMSPVSQVNLIKFFIETKSLQLNEILLIQLKCYFVVPKFFNLFCLCLDDYGREVCGEYLEFT